MASTKLFRYLIISLLALLAVSTPCVVGSLNASTLCIEEEREALLKIKKDLKDPHNCLSSWVGNDCCNWIGIQCHHQTGYVLKLDFSSTEIGGEINPAITRLKHLTHLDLSFNDFEGNPIPKFIGTLNKLRYLDLSHANFSGMVPTHLKNLSNLLYLNISLNPLWIRDVSWLSALSSLQYLNMNFVSIASTSHEMFRAVNLMSSLLELHLSGCNLRTLPPSLQFENITSLSVLDLSGNHFNSSMPSWLFNMSNLAELYLSTSSLRGSLPVLQRGNLCKLQVIHLSGNYLTGDITQMLNTLSSCSNHRIGKLSNSVGKVNSLLLDLSLNSFSGPIPASIGNLSNLYSLNLKENMMIGEIPESIGQLSRLEELYLLDNNWEGTITNTHFHNLTNLVFFSISSEANSFAFKVTQEWIPPFKHLSRVDIRDCQVGPTFPSWFRNLTLLKYVRLENVGISGEIPHWFYMSSQIGELDLSHNKISGFLPKLLNFSSLNFIIVNLAFNQLKGSIPLWSGVRGLDLSNNLLSGTVPTNIGEEMSDLTCLDLSNNHLNGIIPPSINRIENLLHLDLSNNYLIGTIPVFWMGMQELSVIDLSDNSLSGGIPASICSLPSLDILELSNNNLSEDLSSAFQNCTSMLTLSLGNNRFLGLFQKKSQKTFLH